MKSHTFYSEPTRITGSARSAGFTLVGMTISTVVAAFVLTGAWLAFASMRAQWRVSHAERQMDQYAHSAMMELTNNLSWAWSATQVQGGPRNLRWKFGMQDIVEEYGSFDRWKYKATQGPQGVEPPGGFITLSYQPSRGILWNNLVPEWVADRTGTQYQWGGVRRQRGQATFDRRDRMTMESMVLDFNRFSDLGNLNEEDGEFTRRAVVDISIVMHYQYSSPTGWGLFGKDYVRERVYRSQILLRNWDTENNAFRDDILGEDAPDPSGT